MPRTEVNLGDGVGVQYHSPGSFGARENPQRTESRYVGFVLAKPPKPPKRPCCKTCGDRGCVGHCKY
jgi:hypothetical protein